MTSIIAFWEAKLNDWKVLWWHLKEKCNLSFLASEAKAFLNLMAMTERNLSATWKKDYILCKVAISVYLVWYLERNILKRTNQYAYLPYADDHEFQKTSRIIDKIQIYRTIEKAKRPSITYLIAFMQRNQIWNQQTCDQLVVWRIKKQLGKLSNSIIKKLLQAWQQIFIADAPVIQSSIGIRFHELCIDNTADC